MFAHGVEKTCTKQTIYLNQWIMWNIKMNTWEQ